MFIPGYLHDDPSLRYMLKKGTIQTICGKDINIVNITENDQRDCFEIHVR